MFSQLGNLADLMRNAGKLRESVAKATEALGQLQVEGTSGGGAVTAKVNGRLEVVSIRIDPKLLADGDTELLEDLVAAAVNAGLAKARDTAAQSLASLAGGLPLGPVPDGRRRPGRPGRRLLTMAGFSARGGRPPDHGPGTAARHRRQVGRAARPPPAQVPRRRGPRTGRGDPDGQGADPPLPGLLPPHRGGAAHLRHLPRPPPRPGLVCVVEQSRDLLAIEKAGSFTRASTTSCSAAWPRSRGWGRTS